VRFAHDDEVFEIPHLNDLSEDVISNVWMSREELSSLRRQCASIVTVMVDVETAAKHGVCLRGLEQNTPGYVVRQMAIRNQIYDTINAIQEYQEITGTAVPELIAKACLRFSAASAATAYDVGMNDARYVITDVLGLELR
jgi:hypothetical protein